MSIWSRHDGSYSYCNSKHTEVALNSSRTGISKIDPFDGENNSNNGHDQCFAGLVRLEALFSKPIRRD